MIWVVVFLGFSTVAQWFFIINLMDAHEYLLQRFGELTNAHNWNVKELEHRAEQRQVVKVVEL